MKTKCVAICFVLLVTFIRRAWSKTCIVRTESDEIKTVCCADYEAKENDCIACSKGYTSAIGENCRPCPNNMYGARCGYECSCSVFQTCDKVEGCVEIPSTIGTSVITTSDEKTSIWTFRTPTYSEYGNFFPARVNSSDSTTLPQELDASTNYENTEKSVPGLLSREIIVYYTLSITVVVLGICLCFIFYKYKIVTKKKKATITRSPNPSLPQNTHNIEIEERVYDIIDDTDMLQDENVLQMPDYLDVICGSNSTGSGEDENVENHDYPDQSLSTDQIKKLVNKGIFTPLNDSENTSSSGEDHQELRQDYLNPYQSVIKTSPPNIREYLTLATVHNRTDSSRVDNKSGVSCKDENILQYAMDLEEIGLRRPYEYEDSSISVECAVPRRCLLSIRGRESKSCENVNYIKRVQMVILSGKDDTDVNSNKDYRLGYYNVFKTKSESDIFCKHVHKK